MEMEESGCIAALKSQRMFELSKSKRKAYVSNLRKKVSCGVIPTPPTSSTTTTTTPFTSFSADRLLTSICSVVHYQQKLSFSDSKDLKHQLISLHTCLMQTHHDQFTPDILESLLSIIQCRDTFPMDIVLQTLLILIVSSGSEAPLPSSHLAIFTRYATTFISFLQWCTRINNQQQSSLLISKIITISGNIALESLDFAKQLAAATTSSAENSSLFTTFANTILYLPNTSLIMEAIWLLGILYKTTRTCSSSAFAKNIAFLLKKHKENDAVVQELLWYLVSLSSDNHLDFHAAYFDDTVLARLLDLCETSSHTGNVIATLTLLSNVLAVQQPSSLTDIFSFNNDSSSSGSKSDKLRNIIRKCLTSSVTEIQRETLVLLSNIAVIYPLFLAQHVELINQLIEALSQCIDHLFVDLCYIFFNLFISLPNSRLLSKQHTNLDHLILAILANTTVQEKYANQLATVFANFAAFIALPSC